nr:glycoside hydrolase family 57 protein [Vulcanisaeta distributa]
MSIELTTNKVLYEPGEDITVNVMVRGLMSREDIELTVIKDSQEITKRVLQAIPPESEIMDYVRINDVGTYEISARCCGSEVRTPVMIINRPETPLRFVLVFHNHQPIHKYPSGIYHGPWAFQHTWSPEFYPIYDVGPYLLHARLVNKYRVSVTYNLSPSLLWQWDDLLRNGVFIEGADHVEYIGPWDSRVGLIKEAINTYSRLANEGVIEVLTSFLAHPIAGYLIEKFEVYDLLRWELSRGKEVTRRVLGVNAVGMWLPELYFSEKLRNILCDEGIRFIVLDGVYHLGEAIKDRSSIYRVYRHDCLTILFRDTALSDLLSFQLNKASNAQEADANARRLIIELMMRINYARDGVVTMALDGENWMILPTPNPYAALLLEKIMMYLSQAKSDGYVMPIRPSIIKEFHDEIKEIPTTSWLGSPAKWISERADIQSRLWSMAQAAISKWRLYEEVFGEDEELRMSLAMTLDSDYYWAEFVNVNHVGEWAHSVISRAEDALNSLGIRFSLENDHLEITVSNNWVKDANLVLGIETPETYLEYSIKVQSGSSEPIRINGFNNVVISLLSPKTRTQIRKPIKIVREVTKH